MTQTRYSLNRAIELRESFRSEGYQPFERYFDSEGLLHIKLDHHNHNRIEIVVNSAGASIYKNQLLKKIEIFPNNAL